MKRHMKDKVSNLLLCTLTLVSISLALMPRVSIAHVRSAKAGANDEQENHDKSPLVSNVFYETDLREVLLNISDQTGIPIIADQTVQAYVTMEISNLPLEECLKRVLNPFGYTFKKMEGYYLVGSADPSSPSFHILSTTETITPNYLKATDVVKLISSYYNPYVKADAETNRLTITASPEVVTRFKEDLEKIDIPLRQVMIEALVTEVSEESLKEFGINATIEGTKGDKGYTAAIPLAEVSDSSFIATGIRIGELWGGWTVDYHVALKALIMDGKADIRANPKLATVEGQAARIFIGQDQYHTIATGREPYVYTRLEVIKVGISLEITPYVTDAGEITVEVKAIVSDVSGMGATGLPVVNTRDVTTKIKVRDGESIVIGGLQTENKRTVMKKLPILGDIPILGYLFRNNSTETRKTEIIILITPHLLEE